MKTELFFLGKSIRIALRTQRRCLVAHTYLISAGFADRKELQ